MLLPDNIDLSQTEKYILSLRISDTTFSYSIHEPRVNGDFCYRETSFANDSDILNNIQSIIFDYNFLTHKYKQTNVVFVSNNYELVPAYLIEKNKIRSLYNFTHNEKFTQILSSPTPIQNNTILFGANDELYKFLVRSLFNPQFYHHIDPILRFVNGKNRIAAAQNKMYLHFNDQLTDISCYNSESKLLHVSTLSNENNNNRIYHILNIWEKSNFDQRNDYIYVLGKSIDDKYQPIIDTLKEYIQNIEVTGIPNEVELLKLDEDIQIPLDLLILSIS